MFSKITAIVDLFRKGEEVTRPAAWKNAQNMGLILGGFMLAAFNLVKIMGWYDIPIDTETANTIGLGVATLAGFVLNNFTSAKAGILPAKPKLYDNDFSEGNSYSGERVSTIDAPDRGVLRPENQAHAESGNVEIDRFKTDGGGAGNPSNEYDDHPYTG